MGNKSTSFRLRKLARTTANADSGFAASTHTHVPTDTTWSASYRTVTDTEKSTWNAKQDALVSATNIKTVNGTTILGSGNLTPTTFALSGGFAANAPSDSTDYYFGAFPQLAPQTSGTARKICFPVACTIFACDVYILTTSTVGSAEDVSLYIRLNNTSDTLVETLGASNASRRFNNDALAIAVAAGDYIEFKLTCPAWATNPSSWQAYGHVFARV